VGKSVAELAGLIERFTGKDGAHATSICELTLARFSGPSEPAGLLYEPSLCLIAQGSKDVLLAEELYNYGPANFLLVSADVPVTCRIIEASPEAPYLGLRIAIDPAAVGELVADVSGLEQGGPPPGRAVAVSPVEPLLLDAVCRLLALLDSPRDVAALAPLILREITYRLLTGDQGTRLRQIAVGDGQGRRVARAIRWLKEHFARPLRIADLAREVRMSPSALHHHFKAVTAMSPLQYQKRLRLQEARRLMLGEGLDAAEAGFRVGYESPSQFSREYRRLFGAPPRRDVAALQPGASVLV
jgi:AraC-like DNA-binding protein